MGNKKGISLIVLVITIIVIIILASAVILSLSNNNPITQANEATYKANIESYNSELNMTLSSKYVQNSSFNPDTFNATTWDGVSSTIGTVKEYIPSMSTEDCKNYIISQGKLFYVGNDSYQKKWAKELGIINGLVMYLDAANTQSYSGSGDTWYDLSGNGNNLTLTNGPVWNSQGYFVNDNDSYFTGIGNGLIPVSNSSYCIGVWARQNTVWGTAQNGFISIGEFNITNQSNALRAHTTLGSFRNYWWANDLDITNNTSGLQLGKWFYVLAQFDGTKRSIWINGVNVANDYPTSHNVTSTRIQVSKTVGTEYQQGDIAIAFIYNRALSQSEIEQSYNSLKSRFGL